LNDTLYIMHGLMKTPAGRIQSLAKDKSQSALVFFYDSQTEILPARVNAY